MADRVAGAMARFAELRAIVGADTDREFIAEEAGGRTLREAFLVACKKLGHEFVRFTLVLRATSADVGALGEVLPSLADAESTVVAGLQLLAKPGVGPTLQEDVRKFGRALTQAILDSVTPIAPASAGPLASAVVAAQTQRALHRAGVVLQLVEQAERLPTSNVAAVRRRLLQLGKLAKSSAEDVAREHADGEGGGGRLEEEGEGRDGEDEDDPADAECSAEVIRVGCDALRTTASAVRVVISLFDTVVRGGEVGAGAAGGGAAAAGGGGKGASVAGATAASVSGGSVAGQGSDLNWPDRIALACDAVKDAIVDFAAAISDNDEIAEASTALQASAARLSAVCAEIASAASVAPGPAQSEALGSLAGLWEALGEQLKQVVALGAASA